MSSDLLRAFFDTVADHQQKKIEHPADDFGKPICKCEACRAKSERMQNAFVDYLLRTGDDPDRTLPRPLVEFIDYDGDMGREWQDTQRDQQRTAARARTVPDVPHVAAPSIVPEGTEDA